VKGVRSEARRCIIAGLFLILLIAFGSIAAVLRPDLLPEIGIAQLPPQARETLQLIKQGGPFPFARDSTVFGNRERLLPPREHGYYREYTVKTPGARDRGARRIVAGGCAPHESSATQRQNKEFSGREPVVNRNENAQRLMAPCSASEYYYTDDHYARFRRIRE
jgi:ribonuclease T1